ncbi:MAG: hypothetical protein M1827_006443 [Pycnora praestabilis]|nr:MAG: hypothetical protein M1827_006443 [Pycnora praestabilis]
MLHRARSKDLANHTPAYMNQPQIGQPPSLPPWSLDFSPLQSTPSNFKSSSDISRSDLGNADSQKAWAANYLTDLRTNRVARPSGSRPLPPTALPNRNAAPTPVQDIEHPVRIPTATSKVSNGIQNARPNSPSTTARCLSAQSQRQAQSSARTDDPVSATPGRPLVQRPQLDGEVRDFSTSMIGTSGIKPSATYVESGQRWMERQEARSLRDALQDKDIQDDLRLHAAAQDQASELVWRHRNPTIPPQDAYAPYNYKEHLRKGSHARSQSAGPYIEHKVNHEHDRMDSRGDSRGVQLNSPIPKSSGELSRQDVHVTTVPSVVEPEIIGSNHEDRPGGRLHNAWDSPQKKAYMNLTFPMPPPRSTNRRRSSGSRLRKASAEAGKGLFRNPTDQIYEEPEEDLNMAGREMKEHPQMPAPLRLKPRNPMPNIHSTRDPLSRMNTVPQMDVKLSNYEIHKNPPSQSHDAGYRANGLPPMPPDSADVSVDGIDRNADQITFKNGVEVRSEDIRAATSMRLKDRSPKLPTPTIVSDRPGRPIVSFRHDWKSKESQSKQQGCASPQSEGPIGPDGKPKALPQLPSKPVFKESSYSAPLVPTINIAEPPSIQVNDVAPPPIPTISVSSMPPISTTAPPIPTISAPSSARPLPTPRPKASSSSTHRSATAPTIIPSSHFSLSSRRPTATCMQCALPISGRIVSAASQRFHPECFTCYHCGEGLECVAFYPEPDTARSDRIARIRRRANGEDVEDVEGKGWADDGDEALRFYCHLDFHEFFSPRCRSCKTPIEGEVIVACGGEWHVGHFFCAECGDPFDSSTPFVEKEGYAWCINCHTNRYSTKCKKCRRPVTDMVVKALGAEWHQQCFCCVECGGGFDDGRYFLRGEEADPVCVGCEEKRLKA